MINGPAKVNSPSNSAAPTALQQACIMHSLLLPASGHYIQQLVCEWAEPLQINAWKRAWDFVAGRHDALRAYFQWHHADELTQHFADSITAPLEIIRGISPDADRVQVVSDFLDTDRTRGFNLTSAPLWRLTVFPWKDREATTVWTFHHSLLDGRSHALVWQEVDAAYRGLLAGTMPALPQARSFREFTAWLTATPVEAAAAYWRERLRDFQTATGLPTIPLAQNCGNDDSPPAMETLTLTPAATTRLREAAERHDVTLNNLVQAAWALALSQNQAVEEIVFGVVRSGRHWTNKDPNGRVGMFINTIPFRVDTSHSQPVGAWLQGLRAQQLAARAGEHASVEQIRRWCGLPGSTVMFRTLLMFKNHAPSELLTNAIQRVRLIEKTDLPTLVANAGTVLTLNLDYSPRRHSPVQARTVLEQIHTILEALASASGDLPLDQLPIRLPEDCRLIFDEWQGRSAARPDQHHRVFEVQGDSAQRAGETPLLTVAERQQILVEWNRTEREYPRDKCVHQLFEEQVERTPDAVAVVFEEQSLTYRELNVRANRLANHLRGLGVGPESLVALCLERSLEMIVAILGTMKAGGAYVPIDPAYPADRVAFMLADANAPVLLTQEGLREKLPPTPSKVICLDSGWETIERESKDSPATGVTADNLAYVIYTSGSTGQPKGVLITHHNVVRLMRATTDWFHFGERDVWTMFHSYAFDFSVWEIWGALLYGGRLVVVPYFVSRSPDAFYKLLATEKVTVLNQTPSAFHQLIQAESSAGTARELTLRYVIFGGEALQMQSLKPWFERHGDARPQLVNMYGITETTVHITYRPLTKKDAQSLSVIGVPIPDLQVHILDSHGKPVPIGVPGEMFIGGAGLARGYLNRPELTAERFISHPFSSSSGARLYKTGDLARRLPDGDIEYLGRSDHQVKIRGHRIELGEIEAAMGGHPEVASCAVVIQDRGSTDKTLAAFVVGRERAVILSVSLRQWLAKKLPDYMIPSRFVAVPALPLNPNGKLDRKALEKLDGVELTSCTDYVAPRNERERELVEIWQAVLRRERVGVQDNFFDLGGHSLLAAVMGSQIRRRLGLEVSLRWIFEHPTIERLSAQVEVLEGQRQIFHPIEKADREKPLPMSFGQQGMWLLQQTLPDPATYNLAVAWRLSGRVDSEKVRGALMAIQTRHEVLRTALVQQGENLVQQIASAKEVSLPWQEIDMQAVPPDQKEEVLAGRLLAEARRPFDLAHAPLWRAVWVGLAADEQVLAFTFHHSIMDEWSLRLFIKELDLLHAADGQPEPACLLELPVQYSDYALWERKHLTGEILELHRAYWRMQLLNLPPTLELPANLPRPVQQSGRGAVHHFQLIGSTVTNFRELAREEETTVFTVVLVAFHLWLHRLTGQKDIVVGTPITQRQRLEFHPLIGFFLNTLPIRMRLEDSQNFREVVRQMRKTLLGAFEYSNLPFEQMVELAVKERVAGQQPLYQVMFVLLEEGLPPLRLDQARSQLMPMDTGTSKNELTLNIQAVGESWDCQLEYATDLFNPEGAARMVLELTELFRTIAENSRAPVGQLRLMPEGERRQILVEWNQTERDYPRDKCVHQLFEEQVERTPDAVAVVFEEQSLAYRELNARSNQLAHHLRSLGVGPESLVALCLERSLEMIVAILGTIKAGAAYVPIDPAYPADRVAFMLTDANAPVLLTQKTLRERLPPTPEKIICLDSGWETIERESKASPVTGVTADNLAYVIYTSGSTGSPKGAMNTHRGICNRLLWMQEMFQLSEADRVLQKTPFSFDVSVWEFFWPLLAGARLVIARPDGHRDNQYLIRLIISRQITTLHFVPSMLRHFLQDAEARNCSSLRRVFCSGEALPWDLQETFFERMPGVPLHNLYGPTEAAVDVTHWTCKPDSGLRIVPIGRPIANIQTYILDKARQPVPVGVAGELHIGGVGLARGYLNRPELTAERFIPHPFSDEPDARLYRTGDLARYMPDGNIEFLGRTDFQVKLRGFRIELGEVEAVLRAQPEVREAVVIAREDMPGDKRLIAYLVAKTGEKPDVLTLRTRLAEKLPEYMIPAAFVWLDQLPLTSNGKLDRKALPAPGTNGGKLSSETSQSVNLLELELTRIWRRLFQREDIGRQDNFFLLGGHSLMAVRLAVEIDKLLKCKLPIATLFQSPTIESLARRLADDNWTPPWSSLVPLQPQGSKPPLFFVHGWGGDVYGHLELAKLLPLDQPSYGIQAVGLDGKSARHITVEDMAAHYVKEIVSFQPDGPLYLAGYSMGGLIAFEVAQQLHRLGRRVALLALLDSAPIGKIPWVFYGLSMASYIPDRCLFHFRRWLKLSRHEKSGYLRGRWIALRFWLVRNRSKAPFVTAPPQPASQPPQVPGFDDYYHAVAAAYRVRPYPGSADVFVSEQASPGWKWWYWRHFARGGVSLHRIPGRHFQILLSPDFMPELAKSLASALHRTQEEERANHSHDRHNHD